MSIGIGTDNGAKTISSPRYTPYHVPHRTEIAGFMTILHGDDRFYNNIFIQQEQRPAMLKNMKECRENKNVWDDCNIIAGTWPFSEYPTYEEWKKEFDGYCGMGSLPSDRYYIHLPVWTGGNVFFNGAVPSVKENDYLEDKGHQVTAEVEERDDGWYLKTDLYDYISVQYDSKDKLISTDLLGMAFEPEEKYENPDGTPITFDEDYYGVRRDGRITPGPFASAKDILNRPLFEL